MNVSPLAWLCLAAVSFLASCSNVKPDGALAVLAGEEPGKPKSYDDRNHIQPTLPSGPVRWKVDF